MGKRQTPNQYTTLRDYLLQGHSITSMEAFELFGITRLSAKIFDLRKAGYDVQSKTELSVTRYGTKCYYSRYYIPKF
jgi:hypothetical protein